MRQKRAKSYKKQMNVYLHTYKFREPFQTIIDSDIILLCEKSSFDLIKGIKRTIQADVKPMITQCCMQALYKTENQSAIDIGKSFERRRCNHPPSDPLTPKECIKSIIAPDNKHRYILASQVFELRKELMNVPGVPMIFMNRSVMVMEPISKKTLNYAKEFEAKKLTQGLNAIAKPKKADTKTDSKPVKRKGPSEPNPLSIKKKKIDSGEGNKDQKEKHEEHKEDNNSEDQKGNDKEKKTRRKRKHTKKTTESNGDKHDEN